MTTPYIILAVVAVIAIIAIGLLVLRTGSMWAAFGNSETIVWTRIQVLIGAVWVGLSGTDLSPVLNPKYMVYWLIINGIVTEYLRRRNDNTITTLTGNAPTSVSVPIIPAVPPAGPTTEGGPVAPPKTPIG